MDDRRTVLAALTEWEVAGDKLAGLSWDALSLTEIVEVLDRRETVLRREASVGHRLLARLITEHRPWDLGARIPRDVLKARLRISGTEATRRLGEAEQLGPRRAMTGEPLAPLLAHTAAGVARGAIGAEHIKVIRDFLKDLPGWVDAITREQAEHDLAEAAPGLGPEELRAAADRIALLIDDDGPVPDEREQSRKRGIVIGPQGRDGLSKISGYITARCRAALEVHSAKNSAPGAGTHTEHCDRGPRSDTDDGGAPGHDDETGDGRDGVAEPGRPGRDHCEPDADTSGREGTDGTDSGTEPGRPGDDDGSDQGAGACAGTTQVTPEADPPAPAEPDRGACACGPDLRTQAQRNHDALQRLAEWAIASGDLGQINGVPATIVAAATVQDLESATGHAVTGGGTLLPMRDVINLASNAHHYLAIFDGHTEEALYLGRAKRCASTAQRLMLFARDRGCTKPGCTAPFYRSQVHHAEQDWKAGGLTNIDDLTLACQPDNNLIEKTAWTTRRRNGRTEWLPPPELDTGQTRTNNYHHPQRYLTPKNDDEPA